MWTINLMFILIQLFPLSLSMDPLAYSAYDYQGTQIIESVMAYTNNLRYSRKSGRMWFTADKGIPNAYFASSKGHSAKNFNVPVLSLLNETDSLPYFNFDVINVKDIDFIIGTTYGIVKGKTFGMALQVASSKDFKVVRIYTKYCFFYSIVVDDSTTPIAYTYTVYLVGYCFGNTTMTRGFALSRAFVQLNENISISWREEDIYVLDSNCYDILTEINKPQVLLNKEIGGIFLYISVPGRCNAIYKVAVHDGSPFAKIIDAFLPNYLPSMNETKITSTAFSKTKKNLFCWQKI